MASLLSDRIMDEILASLSRSQHTLVSPCPSVSSVSICPSVSTCLCLSPSVLDSLPIFGSRLIM